MKFFDWSIGYVYIVCYMDSVSVYPEQVVVSSRHCPVDGIAGAALGLTAVLPFGGFFANLLAQISMLTSHYCGLWLPLFVMAEVHNT